MVQAGVPPILHIMCGLKQTVVLTPTVYKQKEQAIRHSSQVESSNVPLIAGLLDNGQFGNVGRKVTSLSLKIWPTKRCIAHAHGCEGHGISRRNLTQIDLIGSCSRAHTP